MIEYRKAKPEENEACIELANYVFSTAHNPHDFEKLLPKVYSPDVDFSSMHYIAVDEKGKLHAQVAIMPGKMNINGQVLNTGFIGTVSVHPKARGEGHMKALMNACLTDAKKSCSLLTLSGQRQRYEYFGYTGGGREILYTINKSNVRHALKEESADDISFDALFAFENAAEFMYKLNTSRFVYMERDIDQMQEITKSFGQHVIAILKNKVLSGYIIADKNGTNISEIALLDTIGIKNVMKAYMQYSDKKEIQITMPEYEMKLNTGLADFAETCMIQSSGMYNILDFASVLEAGLALKNNTDRLTEGRFSAVFAGQPVTININDEGVQVERHADKNAPAIDKEQAQRILLAQFGNRKEFSIPKDWFPLPLFWYSADKF